MFSIHPFHFLEGGLFNLRKWPVYRIFHRFYLLLPTGEKNKAAALGVMKAPTLGRKSGQLVSQSRAVCIVALEGSCSAEW